MEVAKLIRLARESLAILDRKIKAKKLKAMKHVVVKYRVTDLTETGHTGTFEPSERIDWSLGIHDLVEKEVKNLAIFKEIVKLMVKEYENIFPTGVNKVSQSEFWLVNFVGTILRRKMRDQLTEEDLIELATTFRSELDSAPIQRYLTLYVDGVFSKVEPTELMKNVKLRKLEPSDLEYEQAHLGPPPAPHTIGGMPRAVMEIRLRAKNDSKLHGKAQKTLTLLRLFRLGSVYSMWQVFSSGSVMWPMGRGLSWSSGRFSPLYSYEIDASDVSSLKKFCETYEPLLPKKEDKTLLAWNSALSWYNNALLEPVQIERRLMTAIMGLECLYSLPSDRGELAFRLSQRVAKLLGLLKHDPINVKKNIEGSYRIRSKVAHGSIAGGKRKEIKSLLDEILEYLRKSLLVFIRISPLSKNELVVLIDNSMISASHFEQLKKIAKNLGVTIT